MGRSHNLFKGWQKDTSDAEEKDFNTVKSVVPANKAPMKNSPHNGTEIAYGGIDDMEVADLTEQQLSAIDGLGWEDLD